MILVTDSHYPDERTARTAGVGAAAWTDLEPAFEVVVTASAAAPYQPGAFHLRELPGILALLDRVPRPDLIVVDAYVWLDGRPGLGARLHDATGLPVVGIAKTRFRDAPAVPVLRGTSARPLFVSAVGLPATEAADHVRAMVGPHRIPALVKRADALARATG